MKWKVPFFDLRLGIEERNAVIGVLESNWLTTGPRISDFEFAFSLALERPQIQAVALSNCTAALHLSLVSLEIGTGDEVICPSLTFVATVNAVRYTGATPIFGDICSEKELNLDPEDVKAKISEQTKAILVMHYGGYPCRMAQILDIARKNHLRVVEDACHGPLADWEGQKLGTIGDIGCFSFFSNKNMTTGEGGMVVTGDAGIAEKIRSMRSHGMTASTLERFKGHAFGYDVTVLGYNYRMDEIRAAMGIEQLKKLPEMNRKRKRLVEHYRESIRHMAVDVTIPFDYWNGRHGYHIFPVVLPMNGPERARVMESLAERGVQTSIHYRPVHSFTAYAGFSGELPRTNAMSDRILSLPLYPTLEFDQVDYVVKSLKGAFSEK